MNEDNTVINDTIKNKCNDNYRFTPKSIQNLQIYLKKDISDGDSNNKEQYEGGTIDSQHLRWSISNQ